MSMVEGQEEFPAFEGPSKKTGNTAKLQEKAQCIQVASSDLSCLRSHPAHWYFFISTSSDQQHLSLSLWKRLFKSLYLPFCSKLDNLNSYPFPATDAFLSGNFRGRGVSASARRWVHPACVLVTGFEHRKILESDKCIWGTEFWWCFLYFIYLYKFLNIKCSVVTRDLLISERCAHMNPKHDRRRDREGEWKRGNTTRRKNKNLKESEKN